MLTADSTAEQASAGLDRLTPDELARFTSLNDAYKAKFGFVFILAVRGLTKPQVLKAFERRLQNPPEVEFDEALGQIGCIALLRLQNILRA
jgi:OHCU decarboxylase